MSKTMLDNTLYDDTWFFQLSQEAKWLFLFLITNKSCNLIGCYELPLPIISTYTSLTSGQIDKAFQTLEEKVIYFNGWVIIKNYSKHNPISNPNIEIAKNKLLESLPEEIRNHYLTLSKGCQTLQGNGKGKGKGNTSSLLLSSYEAQLSELKINTEYHQELAQKYGCTVAFIFSKIDDLENWVGEKPSRARGRNLRRTLAKWVKDGSIEMKGGKRGQVAFYPGSK